MSNDTRNWSSFQEDIFEWADKPKDHLMIEAGAGCGKTTTIVEMHGRIARRNPGATIQFMAFNKKISEELQSRGVSASTMNSFGNQIVRRNFPYIKLDTNKLRNLCKLNRIEYSKINIACRCVDLMKAYLTPKDNPTHDCIQGIVRDFELSEDSLDRDLVDRIADIFVASLKDTKTIDFADQISYPYYHNLSVPKFDYVIIDEAQDMSPNKLALVSAAIGKHLICVGDPYQAIYGFAGADSESMNKIKERFNPVVKSLPVTYRCGKLIVAEAHKYKVAPKDFQAGPNNHDGLVRTIKNSDFQAQVKPKDFVLCRVTAPLVTECFGLIKRGIRGQILGRDVGKKLSDLIDKIIDGNASETMDMPRFSGLFESFRCREVSKLRSADKDAQADSLEDQLDCLWVFVEGEARICDIKARIELMFDDSVNPSAVIFSTIHKAKGLEADNVFCLPYKCKPAKKEKRQQEERNLLYVQITRAKHQLCWVTKE